MAMDGVELGTLLASALGVTDAVAISKLQDFANEFISYIQTHAVVNTTDTGTAGPYPVVATGTGTVT